MTDDQRLKNIAREHELCDNVNCFASEDAWACAFARALLTEMKVSAEAEAKGLEKAAVIVEMHSNYVTASQRAIHNLRHVSSCKCVPTETEELAAAIRAAKGT